MLSVYLLDWRPDSLGTAADRSLLLTPLGPGPLLREFLDAVAAGGAHDCFVVPRFDCAPAYAAAVRKLAPEVEVVAAAAMPERWAGLELSDRLLLVDVRYVPARLLDYQAFVADPHEPHSARFIVHLADYGGGAREEILFDDAGRVRAIRRYYGGVTDIRGSFVSAAVLSLAAAREISWAGVLELAQVRVRLAAGRVQCRDVRGGAALDLGCESELLSLQAWRTRAAVEKAANGAEEGAVQRLGAGARVDPSARLVGPVIVEDQATIEDGAIVVGPAVIGAGSRVGSRCVICGGVVLPGAQVEPGSVAVRRVLRGADRAALTADGGSTPFRTRTAAFWHGKNGARANGATRANLWIKRSLDVAGAGLGLLLLAPLLAVTALLVKLTSRGPALFAHEREGLRGRTFRCWKFRTMVQGAHQQQRKLYANNQVDGPQFKMRDDPRVTALGYWLRLTNIDELPQLWNVLRGDMSLIGPRPSPFRENQVCVPWRRARLSVRPGITGLWQVCRDRGQPGDFHQWIYYDILYVRHWSLWLDLRILLATLVTLGGRWSVPLRWLIPAKQLQAAAGRFSAPRSAGAGPRRHAAAADRMRPVLASGSECTA